MQTERHSLKNVERKGEERKEKGLNAMSVSWIGHGNEKRQWKN